MNSELCIPPIIPSHNRIIITTTSDKGIVGNGSWIVVEKQSIEEFKVNEEVKVNNEEIS